MKRMLYYLAVLMFALGEIAFANPSNYPILAYSPYTTTSTKNAQCLVKAAREQASVAMGLLNASKYDQAYALAGSAWEYLGICHRGHGDDRVGGDAMLVVALVEAQRGQRHLANADAGIATAEYQFCYQKSGASSDVVSYCRAMERKIDSMSH